MSKQTLNIASAAIKASGDIATMAKSPSKVVKGWFIAIVNNNSEKKYADKLTEMGYEVYVPTQKDTHILKSGIKKVVDKIVLPTLIFIHTSESERRYIVTLPFILRFMTNRAGLTDGTRHPIAVIPDKQIERLKFMLYNADEEVEFNGRDIRPGDKVKVIRGKLQGLEGYVSTHRDGSQRLYIELGILGYASVSIPLTDVELTYD